MIEIKGARKIYFNQTPQEVVALENINLSIDEKDFLIIIGSNGSGKSSLLNSIAGTVKLSSGKILFDKTDVTPLTDFERSKWVARIFQNPLLGTAPDLTVLDNFRLAALRTHSKKLITGLNKKFIDGVKSKVSILNLDLENKLSQKMGSLSGGQRQALTLLMAVMDDAKILLLDEPTAALDPKSAETVMALAQKIILHHNLTAILVTHNMKDANQYGNRLIQMQEGKVLRDIAVEEKKLLRTTELFEWFV
jgi:putative tryptophan/tyrosine transport system ATP-binding protein